MIPERNQVKCEQCGDIIDCQGQGHAQFVSGWTVNRVKGGANGVVFPERQRRWLCRWCIDKRRSGVSSGQGELFGRT